MSCHAFIPFRRQNVITETKNDAASRHLTFVTYEFFFSQIQGKINQKSLKNMSLQLHGGHDVTFIVMKTHQVTVTTKHITSMLVLLQFGLAGMVAMSLIGNP